MAKVTCAKTKKEKAEEIRKKLISQNALNQDYKVVKDQSNVYFPLKKDVEGIETIEKDLEPKETNPNSLKEALEDKLTEKELDLLVTSFDIIGDIAVIEMPEELEKKEKEIGKAIMEIHPSVSTVCKRQEKTQGKYRVRPVEVITGEEKTETLHKEHRVKMKLDLNKMYFNSRLSHEREIVADKINPGEEIGYLFAGVGPFALVAARKNQDIKITAVELNPDAYRYLEENIMLNKFTDKIKPLQRDVKDLEGYSFDRVIAPMPTQAENFIEPILKNTADNAVIHYYSLGEKPNPFKKPLQEIEKHIDNFKVLDKREVLSYSPGKKEVVLDIQLLPKTRK